MIKAFMKLIGGNKLENDAKKLVPILSAIQSFEPQCISMADSDFPAKTAEFRQRFQKGETLDELLPEAYAVAREAARRALGERPYDVQLLGAIVLHQGKIMELKTGEGKTLSSVPAAYLNALPGLGVHCITVNDYLAERDAKWMKPVFDLLGLSVGYIVNSMDGETRRSAYGSDITYGTNNEFGFDYLRDNMRYNRGEKLQTRHNYCIIDEIDSILIDESRTPLIISGRAQDDVRIYANVNKIVGDLRECEKDPETGDYPEEPVGDYKLDEKSKRVSFTDEGLNNVEKSLQKRNIITGSLFDAENFEYIHHATQAVRAHLLYKKDVAYVVKEGQVQIVDEFTGRILAGRRYGDGLHQAIEAKEGIKIAQRNRTLATITFQNFFRMYDKISGMTGTAATEAKEFGKIYGLDVVVVPTNRPVIREDEEDYIFLSAKGKYQAIVNEIKEVTAKGQPILVGTASIEKSELISQLLTRAGVKHEVLNAKNHAREATIIAEAGAKGSVTIATNMAGRGTDIKLGGNPEFQAMKKVGTEADEATYQQALAEETAQWRIKQQEIRGLGGLYILGTERHESRRIDNQLRGRAGRQGDPGRSRFYISMDDDLMRLFGGRGEYMKGMMRRMGMAEDEPINHSMLSKAMERAQSKVEERNFDIRKHLLEFDDVLTEQRTFIYDQRDAILTEDAPVDRVLRSCEDVLDDLLEDYRKSKGTPEEGIQAIFDGLRTQLLYSTSLSVADLAPLKAEQIRQRLMEQFTSQLEEKRQAIGDEDLNTIIRIEYIRAIDQGWQDHLEALEELREAVYLRGYAQKNPLLEYKLEGFQIFDELLLKIRLYVAKRFFMLRTESLKGLPRKATGLGEVNAVHRSVGQFGGAAQGSDAAQAAQQARMRQRQMARKRPGSQVVTQVRTLPKLGRNEVVTIRNASGKEEQMKWKKAEELVQSGQWKLIDPQ